MELKQIMVILVLAACWSANSDASAQTVRKAGQYVAGKLFSNTAKKSAKTALRKSGQRAAKGTVTAGGKHLTKGALTQSGKLAANYGDDAARAMSKLSPQNARRLSMMGDDIAASGQGSQVMKLIAEGGDADRVVSFLWRNKATISGGAVLATFVVNPEPFLSASEGIAGELADSTGQYVTQPIIEEMARPIAHWVGSALFCFVLGCCGYFLLFRRPRIRPVTMGPAHVD